MKFKKLLSTLLIATTIFGPISICSKICASTRSDETSALNLDNVQVIGSDLPTNYEVFTCKRPEEIYCPDFNRNSCWMDATVGFVNYLYRVFPEYLNLKPTPGCALLPELMAERLLKCDPKGCNWENIDKKASNCKKELSRCFKQKTECEANDWVTMLALYLFNHNEKLTLSAYIPRFGREMDMNSNSATRLNLDMFNYDAMIFGLNNSLPLVAHFKIPEEIVENEGHATVVYGFVVDTDTKKITHLLCRDGYGDLLLGYNYFKANCEVIVKLNELETKK